MGYFDFGEKGSMPAPSSDVFAPFNGFSAGGNVRGGVLPLGPTLGDAPAVYRPKNTWGFDPDNGSIVMQYVSDHKSLDHLKADTGPGNLMYACNRRMTRWLKAKEMGRARAEPPQFHKTREPLEFKALPRLNRFLKSKAGRDMFGKDTDCLRLRQTYRFAGGQTTAVAQSYQKNDEFVLPIVVGRRFRCKDLTRIHGHGAQINDAIFGIWRRYKWTGVPLPEKKAVPVLPKTGMQRTLLARAVRDAARLGSGMALEEDTEDDSDGERKVDSKSETARRERAQEAKEHHARKVTPKIIKKALEAPGIAADKIPQEEFYWQVDIWFGPRGSQPNQDLYLTESFTGDIDFYGVVMEMYGDRSNVMVDQTHAREACHPTTDTDDWKRAIIALPEFDLYIRIR